jgi:hypothetical protein
MPDKNTQTKTLETVAGWLLIALGALSLLFVRDYGSAALMIAVGILVLRRMWRLFATIVGGLGAARSLLILLPGGIAIARWGDPTYLLHALLSLAAFGLAVGVLMWPREMAPLPRFQRPAKLDDNNWREWLLASLQDVGAEPVRDRFPLLALAVFGAIALTAVVAFGGIAQISSRGQGLSPGVVVAVIAALVATRYRNVVWRLAKQAGARSAQAELSREGSRRPVFYLRSFDLDKAASRSSILDWLTENPRGTAEERVTGTLSRVGPVIAIGRPNERLPPLGAKRFYVSNELWKGKVSDVVKVSQLVLWATGTTPGLRWEIEHLVNMRTPEKLILWPHPRALRLRAAEREQEWVRFLDMTGSVFPKPLPRRLRNTRFIYFDKLFNPVEVGSQGIFGNPLLAVLRGKGLVTGPERRFSRACAIALTVASAFAFFCLLFYGRYKDWMLAIAGLLTFVGVLWQYQISSLMRTQDAKNEPNRLPSSSA